MPMDFQTTAGITFIDCILIQERYFRIENWFPLLFHELVHVVQYDVLGTSRFATQYVTGWAEAGFVYEKIPLEVQAYALQHRFERPAHAVAI